MKLFLGSLFFCTSLLFGEDLSQLKRLMDATSSNLKEQEELYLAVNEYSSLREQFVADANNGRLAAKVVRAAEKVNHALLKSHLDYLFSPSFLEEVRYFATLLNEKRS